MTCAAGDGTPAILANLRKGVSPGLVARDHWTPGQRQTVGEVSPALPALDGYAIGHRTRNNGLALYTSRQIEAEVLQAVAAFGAGRVGVVVGTTTSGMAEAEAAFLSAKENGSLPRSFAYAQMELGSPAEFLALAWGLKGPAFTVSTACSSSAKALASGRRLLRLGVCDAVLVGGVDTLCEFTLRGFSALGALSPEPCLPFSPNRRGINIGEAAAFFVMRRDRGTVRLLGAGETSDAHNISAPLPGGEGARDAMAAALRDAGVEPYQVGYVNLHGTGTLQNDVMESRAMRAVFPGGVACSSTKALTGHTLGAAGALEAGICWALLADPEGCLPPQVNDGAVDPDLEPMDLVRSGGKAPGPLRFALSNVFGFGGTNVSLLLGAP
ncbi:MAG: beta-ketoacyl-[acyl-carrier-protein] synthase [Fibrobacteres bacterium]|nr:beta-ketoacyl-[acyl-carrier-protein] synthase [Fibrobacterota bacterium]